MGIYLGALMGMLSLLAVPSEALISFSLIVPNGPSACPSGPSGTATFSTVQALATGAQRLPGENAWSQAGAIWTFETDTDGIVFGALEIAKGPEGTPAADASAVKLDPNSKTWTLSVPSTPSPVDIVWTAAATAGATSPSASGASKSKPKRTAQQVNLPSVPQVTGAPQSDWRTKPRQFQKRADGGSYDLTIIGKLPCSTNTGIYNSLSSPATSVENAAQASLCAGGGISANAAAYSQYEVNNYISSALSSAASANHQAPQQPGVNGNSVFAQAVGKTDTPGYATSASPIACSDVPEAETGSQLVVQEWLAYNSVVKLSNWFYSFISQILPSGTNALALSDDLAATFYTDNPPPATWNQIVGFLAPVLGALSGGLGALSLGVASGLVGAASGMMGAAAAGQAAVGSAMEDMRFTEAANIEALGQDWLTKTYKSLTDVYKGYISEGASASGWTMDADLHASLMANGAWLDLQQNDDTHDNIMDNINKVMNYRMINYLWNASDTFVVYMPYGEDVANSDGEVGSWQKSDCEALQDDWLNCDVPNGAARLFNANNDDALSTTNPKGATSSFNVGISNAVPIDPKLVAAGSVNSWLAGNFNYQIESSFPGLEADTTSPIGSGGGVLSPDEANTLATMSFDQDAAGFFSLPVCQTKDARSFPPASQGSEEWKNSFCGCASESAVGGAQDGGGIRFYDVVSDKIKNKVLPKRNARTGVISGCPTNLNPPLASGLSTNS